MKRIAIIGEGQVGKAMVKFFNDHYDLTIVDTKYSSNHDNVPSNCSDRYEMANNADLVVICLPTPRDDNGFCDTTLVEEAINVIEAPLFLIKSTIEPGTTDRLKQQTGKRIVFSPEYCGESKYWTEYAFHTDIKETPWFTFGGDSSDTEELVKIFVQVVGPTKTYHQTDALTAELAKYVENTFYAMKITFCYEINEICERMGVDYYKMREAWLLDPRISPMHTAVFEDNDTPFGGRCLPKDLSALVQYSTRLNYDAYLLEQVLESNKRIGEIRRKRRRHNEKN